MFTREEGDFIKNGNQKHLLPVRNNHETSPDKNTIWSVQADKVF